MKIVLQGIELTPEQVEVVLPILDKHADLYWTKVLPCHAHLLEEKHEGRLQEWHHTGQVNLLLHCRSALFKAGMPLERF